MRREPAEHLLVRKAQPRMRVARAQFLPVVRCEIGNQQSSARRKHARRFGDRGPRLLGEMKDMVEDRGVRPAIGQWQCI